MNQYTLPKEFGEKWVAALRETPDSKRIHNNYKDYNGCFCGFGLGMSVANVSFSDQRIESRLPKGMGVLEHEIVTLNDEYDKSFAEQANWIEENVTFI